jgi:ArsR family transcriptional regulator
MQNDKLIQMEAQLLSLLGQPTRLQLLYMLKEGEKCLCEINPVMKEDQSVISRHLIKLRKMGLLSYRKEGVSIFYKVEDERIFDLLDSASSILKSSLAKKAKELEELI